MRSSTACSSVVSALVLIGVALLVFASPGLAQGVYVGGGVGRTTFGTEVKGLTDQASALEETVNGWKVFGGGNSRFFGVEGGYRDFGTVDSNVLGANFRSGTTAWDAAAMGRVRVPILDIFAKAGVMWWSRETSLGSASATAKGTDFFWGVGAGVHFGPLGVRVEWERVDIGEPDKLSMVSVSGTIGF